MAKQRRPKACRARNGDLLDEWRCTRGKFTWVCTEIVVWITCLNTGASGSRAKNVRTGTRAAGLTPKIVASGALAESEDDGARAAGRTSWSRVKINVVQIY